MIDGAATTAIVRFFRGIDTGDWDVVRSLLADQVTLDYVSVFGGEVETVPAKDVIVRWKAMLPGFDASQHFLGQLTEVDGTVQGNVRGYHDRRRGLDGRRLVHDHR